MKSILWNLILLFLLTLWIKPVHGQEVKETVPVPVLDFGNFISSAMKYPYVALNWEISGKPIVSFTIDSNGRVIDVKCLKHFGFGMDEEAVGITRLLDGFWIPATNGGKKVKVKLSMPMVFSLGIASSDTTPGKHFYWYRKYGKQGYLDTVAAQNVRPFFKRNYPTEESLNSVDNRSKFLENLYSAYKKGLDGQVEASVADLKAFEESAKDGLALFLAANVYRFHGDYKNACELYKGTKGQYSKLLHELKDKVCE